MEQRLIAKDITRYKIVKKDWFAYNPMRLNIGSISRWQGENDVLVSPDYVVFRCRVRVEPTPLFPAYLDQYRKSAPWTAFVNESGDGSVRTRIYYDHIARLPMRLPDIAEQQKIAECLSSLDAVIAVEGERLAALRGHKDGLMQSLFPSPGQTTPRLRFPKFEGDGEWESATLRCLLVTPATYGIVKAGDYLETGVPMVRGGDIKDGEINSDLPLVDPSIHEQYKRTIVRSGDVLISLVGYPGETAVAPTWLVGSNISRAVGLLRPHQKKLRPDFLAAFLNSDRGRRDVLAPSAGSAQLVVNLGAMNNLKIPLPPLSEQRRIADCCSALDRVISTQHDKIATLNTHKRALMQQLFPAPWASA